MIDGGGGTLGGPQACDCGHLLGDLQQPVVAGRGRCPTGFAGAPPPLPRAGRPGMRWGLDVAAPPASRLVRSWRPPSSLPARARRPRGREGGHQVSALLEHRLPAPPGTWRHTGPRPRLGAAGMGTEFQFRGPEDPLRSLA